MNTPAHRRDVTDREVVEAFVEAQRRRDGGPRIVWPEDVIVERKSVPRAVAYAAMDRAFDRGFLDFGVSLRAGWPTDTGLALLGEEKAGT